MKILIIGANGQLGSVLLRKFSLDHDVVAPPKEDLDLSLIDTIIPKLEIYKPDEIQQNPPAGPHTDSPPPQGNATICMEDI